MRVGRKHCLAMLLGSFAFLVAGWSWADEPPPTVRLLNVSGEIVAGSCKVTVNDHDNTTIYFGEVSIAELKKVDRNAAGGGVINVRLNHCKQVASAPAVAFSGVIGDDWDTIATGRNGVGIHIQYKPSWGAGGQSYQLGDELNTVPEGPDEYVATFFTKMVEYNGQEATVGSIGSPSITLNVIYH
ncbi:fimbrial protein [Sinobacterium caligoides]|uniref:Fimbrial protein n=1 Tax=Sinobacterium caligoides TaxID=933926 RepID=A0A3N2DMN6_9GAMM|nr:fimbrial protein [Sinobacterium caligoides]ROS01067.1 fimbrial protein [Sinobacterium caligoides]